jgi:hypothetical protein
MITNIKVLKTSSITRLYPYFASAQFSSETQTAFSLCKYSRATPQFSPARAQ